MCQRFATKTSTCCGYDDQLFILPDVGEYQQVFTVAMVTVQVGVAQSNHQLLELCLLHLLHGVVVQLRGELNTIL